MTGHSLCQICTTKYSFVLGAGQRREKPATPRDRVLNRENRDIIPSAKAQSPVTPSVKNPRRDPVSGPQGTPRVATPRQRHTDSPAERLGYRSFSLNSIIWKYMILCTDTLTVLCIVTMNLVWVFMKNILTMLYANLNMVT